MFTRERGVDVSFRDVTIKIPDRGYDRGCEWRHAPEAWAEIWEKSVSWVLGPEEDFRLLTEARLVACGGCARGLGQMEKSGVSLSLGRKTFYLKGNKRFRNWTKKSWVFLCFGVPMFYVYMLWTFYVRFAYPYHGYVTIIQSVLVKCIHLLYPPTTSRMQHIISF